MENDKSKINFKGKIKKLKINSLSYIFQYLTEEELFRSIAKCSKYFLKALNKESLYENLVLRSDLFTSKDKTSWKEKYLGYKKLMKSFKSGKSNTSFKMFPCRGHKQVITSICIAKIDVNWKYNKSIIEKDENDDNNKEEDQKYDSWLITGDSEGVLNHWIFDEEEKEYIPKCIFKPDNNDDSNEIRYLNYLEIKSKMYQYEESKNIVTIVFKSGLVHIYNIVPMSFQSKSDSDLGNSLVHLNSRIFLFKTIKTSINEPVQFVIKEGLLFLSRNLHSLEYMKESLYAVESIDLNKVNESDDCSFQKYLPSYSYEFTKLVKEEYSNINDNNKIETYAFNANTFYNKTHFDSNSIKNAFDIVKDKLIILCNHCLTTCFKSSSYNSVEIPNLFIYDAFNKNLQNQAQFTIPKKFILEVRSIKNDIFVTIEYDYKLITHDVSLRSINKPSVSLSKLSFNDNFVTNNYFKRMNDFEFLYNIKGKSFVIYLSENKIKSFSINYGNKNIQDVSDITGDYYKIAISSKTNSDIMIYDRNYSYKMKKKDSNIKQRDTMVDDQIKSLDLDYRYLLVGGTTLVQPKSFVKFDGYEGFHKLILKENSIVGVIGNMLRIYEFNKSISK